MACRKNQICSGEYQDYWRGNPLFSTVILSILLVIMGCGGGAQELTPSAAMTGSLVDPTGYSKIESATMVPELFEYEIGRYPGILVGDVRGDGAPEIIIYDEYRIRILDRNGTEIETMESPGDLSPRKVILGDIDEDGKDDLIVGGKLDGGIRIEVFNGKFSNIAGLGYADIVKADTYPDFVFEGLVYFHGSSSLNIAPKMTGAWRPGDSEPVWTYGLGPVPSGLSLDPESGRLAVSHWAPPHEYARLEGDPGYTQPVNRHADIIVDSADGTEEAYRVFGPESGEGGFVKDGISGVQARFFDLDGEGSVELIRLTERFSDLYQGASVVEVIGSDGDILHRYVGPAETAGSLGFYDDGRRRRVVVAWTRTGRIDLLDEELEPVGSVVLPGDVHDVHLWRIGAFSGNRRVEFLITDDDRIYLLDEDLEIIWSSFALGPVAAAAVISDGDGRMQPAIVSDRLQLFQAGETPVGSMRIYSNPPGADLKVDGQSLEADDRGVAYGLSTDTHMVSARIGEHEITSEHKVERGIATVAELSVPLTEMASKPSAGIDRRMMWDNTISFPEPPAEPVIDYQSLRLISETDEYAGYWLMAHDDFLGGIGDEIFLVAPDSSSAVILDGDLHKFSRYSVSGETPRYSLALLEFSDSDGDGKRDFVQTNRESPALAVRDGAGRLLFFKNLVRGWGSDSLLFARMIDDMLYIRIDCGYLLSPRGVYGLEYPGLRTRFFTAFANRTIRQYAWFKGHYVDSSFTSSNGAELVHPDGREETDTALFLHIVDEEGTMLPGSGVLEPPDNKGHLYPIAIDLNQDGEDELYLLEAKAPPYYPGEPQLHRLTEDGSLEIVYRFPEAGRSTYFFPVLISGKPALGMYWTNPSSIIAFDRDFNLAARIDDKEKFLYGSYINWIDIDGDDTTELILGYPDGFTIVSITGEVEHEVKFEPNDGTTYGTVSLMDTNADGSPEILHYDGITLRLFGVDR